MSFLVILVAGGVLGAWALRRFSLKSNVEGFAYGLMTGLILCAILVLVLGSYRLWLAQLAVFLVGGGGLAHELLMASRRKVGERAVGDVSEPGEPLGFAGYASAFAVTSALVLALISALAPLTSWDAVTAHLALAADYSREGRIRAFEGNAYSAYPHLLHCLYAYVYYQGGEAGAMLLSWALCALACVFVFCLGSRLGGRKCGLIAAAILATAPIFIDQAGTVSLDLAFAGMVAAALNAVLAWRGEKRESWLVLAAFLAGGACGIRHTGYVVCAILGLGVLLLAKEGRVRAALVFGGVALLGAGPWLLRSAIVAGNPIYPFMVFDLGAASIPDAPITAVARHESVRPVTLTQFLMFPWNIIMRPHWYDGWSKSPGGLVLFLGVPGLFVGGKRARWIGAFCILGGICMFFFRQYARYLLPFFVPMMAVAALAACRMSALRWATGFVLLATYGYGLVLYGAAVHFKVPVALGIESREEYLGRRVERYDAFGWVNKNLPSDKTVLTLDPRCYYIDRPTYQNFESLKPLAAKSAEERLRWLRERGIAYLLFPQAYALESPGFRQSEVLGVLNDWRADTTHFVCIKVMSLSRPRGDGKEQVEIYEIHYDE